MKRSIQDDLCVVTHILLCFPFVVKITMGKPELFGRHNLVKVETRYRWYIRWFGDQKQYDALITKTIYGLADGVLFEINGEIHPPF